MYMNEESKVSRDDILDQMQAGHRARLDGQMLQNLKNEAVQFHEVMPERSLQEESAMESSMPESYLNYAAQLLEQLRGVYASSWESCGCSSKPSWNGGYNHFYDPCSGADNPPPNPCQPFDCSQPVCCNEYHQHSKPAPKPDANGCGTKTYYDDCSYKLQKISDQLNRVEAMTKEIYNANQQIAGYLAEYMRKLTGN